MDSAENKQNGYAHVLKYTGIFGGVQGLNILIGLVRSKLVALILGPAGMGLASLLNTIVNFVSQATNLGISFSAVRHLSEIFDSGDQRRIAAYVKTVRSWSIVAALAGAAVCMGAAPLLAGYAFGGEGHTWQVMALAPTVAAIALTGGETAILKGARRLRELAKTQVMLVVMSLVVAVPTYLLMGVGGIIPVITLTALAALGVTARFSLRLYPLSLRGARRTLGEGTDMVRLGLAFIMSGVFGSGAEMIVRSFLNTAGGLDTVGLYNAGYILTVTYAGMVFTAMETDYFPRLSAVNHDTEAVNTAANRQGPALAHTAAVQRQVHARNGHGTSGGTRHVRTRRTAADNVHNARKKPLDGLSRDRRIVGRSIDCVHLLLLRPLGTDGCGRRTDAGKRLRHARNIPLRPHKIPLQAVAPGSHLLHTALLHRRGGIHGYICSHHRATHNARTCDLPCKYGRIVICHSKEHITPGTHQTKAAQKIAR